VETALYHQYLCGQESLTIAEIKAAYEKARIKSPAKVSDVLATCVRRGQVIEAPEPKDSKKAWQITPTGDKYVEGDLAKPLAT
jgi:hypothetical protein